MLHRSLTRINRCAPSLIGVRAARLPAAAAVRFSSDKAVPSIDDAAAMPRHISELSGELLFVLAEGSGHAPATRERLRREIMVVDNVEYADTKLRLLEMSALVCSNHSLVKAPYQLGIVSALIGGWASLPLVFHYASASKFNDLFVTCDPPDVGDADTWLEVGAWSWNWMEPPLGTISFFLLCMQFAREQRLNIGVEPFTERIKSHQADKLAQAYPQYDADIVRAYAVSIALTSDSDEIEREQVIIEARLGATKA